MRTVSTIAEVRQVVSAARRHGQAIAFVPTMGALHAGHQSLIETAAADWPDGLVVVSIFVNPTQFAPHEDLARYPRPFERDVALCTASGAGLIFHPSPAEMYPSPQRTFVEVQELSEQLEGAVRPGHLRGVATVVTKLFGIVQPDVAYFGQKDYQQQALLREMSRDLNLPVDIRTCPTIREPDGLAMSSRNVYLSAEQRAQALCISRSLFTVEAALASGERDLPTLQRLLRQHLNQSGVVIEYALLAHPDTLAPLSAVEPNMVGLIAVRVGSTRLIDNLLYRVAD